MTKAHTPHLTLVALTMLAVVVGFSASCGSSGGSGSGDAAAPDSASSSSGGPSGSGSGMGSGSGSGSGGSSGAGSSSSGGSDSGPEEGGVDGGSDAPGDAGPLVMCTSTGGTAGSQSCCTSISDFPDNCSIGACGCSPTNSHTVQVCTCPAGKCFSPATGCH